MAKVQFHARLQGVQISTILTVSQPGRVLMMRLKCFLTLLFVLGLAAGCGSSVNLSHAGPQIDFGVKAAKMNLWREALFRFERAVQIDPHNAMARNNLAVAYEGIGEFEKARLAYTEALRLDRSNQYIQKNYSRFVEFYSRNKKREKTPLAGREGETAAAQTAPAATPAPAGGTAAAPTPDTPPDPTPQADPRNEPPQVPVTPPKPENPNGASR